MDDDWVLKNEGAICDAIRSALIKKKEQHKAGSPPDEETALYESMVSGIKEANQWRETHPNLRFNTEYSGFRAYCDSLLKYVEMTRGFRSPKASPQLTPLSRRLLSPMRSAPREVPREPPKPHRYEITSIELGRGTASVECALDHWSDFLDVFALLEAHVADTASPQTEPS
eukprot:gnl/Trimastix_PCT/2130.p1 GENE.gnl/Trimastix_PCT/2130~~gnl/Trimastix_PCT/2130.p1  ORF type:complete len:184 (-),score=8.01 gnl/Trimastix_PCT/2130:376-888(-)